MSYQNLQHTQKGCKLEGQVQVDLASAAAQLTEAYCLSLLPCPAACLAHSAKGVVGVAGLSRLLPGAESKGSQAEHGSWRCHVSQGVY